MKAVSMGYVVRPSGSFKIVGPAVRQGRVFWWRWWESNPGAPDAAKRIPLLNRRAECDGDESCVDGLRGETFRVVQNSRPCRQAGPGILVEVVGIEPTSASPTLRALHAYSVFSLAAGYPTGRENSQPVQ